MEEKVFYTLIKKEHMFFGNDFVEGKIIGYLDICVENFKPIRGKVSKISINWSDDTPGKIVRARCTQEQYDRFVEIVNMQYPYFCEFNYEIK